MESGRKRNSVKMQPRKVKIKKKSCGTPFLETSLEAPESIPCFPHLSAYAPINVMHQSLEQSRNDLKNVPRVGLGNDVENEKKPLHCACVM